MKALDTVGGGMRDKGWAEDQDNDDVYRVRSLRVEGSEERGPRDEVSDGSRPQAYVHVSRAEWDHLRAAASERAVLSHEKEDLEQQLVALAENLTTAKATARKAEGNAKHLQVSSRGSTVFSFVFVLYRPVSACCVATSRNDDLLPVLPIFLTGLPWLDFRRIRILSGPSQLATRTTSQRRQS